MADNADTLNVHLQDCVVWMSITSTDFLKLSRSVLNPKLFSSEVVSHCVELCFNYWDRFHEPPGDHFHDELVATTKGMEDREKAMFAEYAQKLATMRRPSLPYILERVNAFVQRRELEIAATRFARLLADDDVVEAERLMLEALNKRIAQVEVGLRYETSDLPLRFNPDMQQFLCPLGIPAFDNVLRRKALKRGQFISFVAPPKGMKTWCLMHIAAQAVMRGLIVVHISHEVSMEEMEDRYDMMFGALLGDDEPRKIERTLRKRTDKTDDKGNPIYKLTRIKTKSERPTIWDIGAVRAVRRKVRRFGGVLIVKKYPMYSVDMREIERFLQHLELSEGLMADLVVNDYADIMQPLDTRKELRHQLNETYMYHKRIADERQLVILTASATSKEGIGKTRLSGKDYSEDVRKLANVDIGIGIAQSEEMKEDGYAVMSLIGSRVGGQGMNVVFGPSLEMGQFHLWSAAASEMRTAHTQSGERVLV